MLFYPQHLLFSVRLLLLFSHCFVVIKLQYEAVIVFQMMDFFFVFYHLLQKVVGYIICGIFQAKSSTLSDPLKDVLSELAKFKKSRWGLRPNEETFWVICFTLLIELEMATFCCPFTLHWVTICLSNQLIAGHSSIWDLGNGNGTFFNRVRSSGGLDGWLNQN